MRRKNIGESKLKEIGAVFFNNGREEYFGGKKARGGERQMGFWSFLGYSLWRQRKKEA